MIAVNILSVAGIISIPSSATVSEANGTVEVCATLTGTTAQNLTVTLTASDTEAGSGGGNGQSMISSTAQAGLDYTSTSETLIFPADSTSGDMQCMVVTIIDDGIRERDETFTVTLTSSDPDVTIGNNQTVVTIIDDNDPVAELNITSSKPPSVLLGDYISLSCSVSTPVSEDTIFTWTHLNSSSVLEETSYTLRLTHISAEQLGTYACNVTSLLTTGAAEITLTSSRPLIQNGSYETRRTDVGACPSASVRDDIAVDVLQLLSAQYGVRPLGLIQSYPADSCSQIAEANSDPRSGTYWIRTGEDVRQENCVF